MDHFTRLALIASLFTYSACATVAALLPPNAITEVQPLDQGELIYRGDVFLKDATAPTFYYERFVEHHQDTATPWVSTHVTRLVKTNELAVVQRSTHSSQYVLHSFKEIHAQTGVVSSVEVLDDGSLTFLLTRADQSERVHESAGDSEDVVVGPTLFGYVLAHWDILATGNTLKVRFAVTERATSYVFTLRKTNESADEVTITMEASSFFVRLATSPMLLSFDAKSHQIVRYEGAIPPRDAELESLDAHVDYRFVSATYR